MRNKIFKVALVLMSTGLLYSQTCELPPASAWSADTLTNKLAASVAFGLTPKGDAFIAEMITGKIKLYKADTKETIDLGKVDDALYVDAGGVIENGLLGVTPDPNYETNKWIYALYSRKMSEKSTTDCRKPTVYDHKIYLVRFSVIDNKLANPKTLFTFQRWSTSHAAGGLTFDTKGNLFVSTGDDSNPFSTNGKYGPRGAQEGCKGRPIEEVAGVNAQLSASNTNDLRGKILRIRPIAFANSLNPAEGPGSTYDIPVGNLYPVGTAKTRPEIYTMGHRNPYRMRVDSVTGWVMIGEVGPDASGKRNNEPRGHDEFNLAKAPGNFGWPYANANNQAYRVQDLKEGDYTVGNHFDLQNLKNKHPDNTGLVDLPPATSALGWYNAGNTQTGIQKSFGSGGESAIGGPRYWYNSIGVASRMPAYFQGKFIVGDWVRRKLWVLDVDATGTLKKVENFRPDGKGGAMQEPHSPIDMDLGPDGVLYVLYTGGRGYSGWKSGGSLVRYEYTGTQYSAASCGDKIVIPVAISKRNSGKSTLTKLYAQLDNQSITLSEGVKQVRAFNLKGEEVYHSGDVSNQNKLKLPNYIKGMVYLRFIK